MRASSWSTPKARQAVAGTPASAAAARPHVRCRAIGVSALARSLAPAGQHSLQRRGNQVAGTTTFQRPRTAARSSAANGLFPLAQDLLTFLGSTVVTVPVCKKLNISPVLGFLGIGVVLHQLGLIRDAKDMEAVSQLGVLFLLFEMGLELSLDRLKALAKYAFGLGTLQMLFCTAMFTAFALPAGQGIGTKLLEWLAHAPSSLVSIRSIDEAVVIGGALSMSSSAFVLQLLTERGEMPTRYGSATLGILLLQDIAVVPFLVLLPLAVQLQSAGVGDPVAALADAASDAVAAAQSNPASLVAMLGPTALKTCAGLGLLLVGGRLLLRRVFEVVAQSDNSETFVGLCLLTVAGAALLTEQLGFSDTMGAFIAGVLLSESSYKTQVEADIRPFRGLLLGLFFVTTGMSIDMGVLRSNFGCIMWMLVGLITIKTSVVAALGPSFGLTKSESIRTGFMLSQGGEFAFVLLSLASSLHVLPDNLNQVLIIVVVLSMALTPGLAEAGKVVGDYVEQATAPRDANGNLLPAAGPAHDEKEALALHGVEEPVVICGFGPHGQMLAALLDQPLASLPDALRNYIAFDLDPSRVQAAREAGFNVVYGDGSRPAVLRAAGVVRPRALAVCLTQNKAAAHKAVESLRLAYPNVPLYCLGGDIKDAAELEEAGADRCIMGSTSMGVALGTEVLTRLGASTTEATAVANELEEAMTIKAHALAEQVARYGSSALETDTTLGGLLSSHRRPAAAPTYAPAAVAVTTSTSAPSPLPANAGYDDEAALAAGAAIAAPASASSGATVAGGMNGSATSAAAAAAAAATAPSKALAAAAVQASVDSVDDAEAARQPVRASTPAPFDTVPSMAEAMPSPRAAPASPARRTRSGGLSPSSSSSSLSSIDPASPILTDEEQQLAAAARVAAPARRVAQATPSSSFASVSSAEEDEEPTARRTAAHDRQAEARQSAAAVMAEATPVARSAPSRAASGSGSSGLGRIAATAMASLETCDASGTCETEDVAGMVLVDAGKQQLVSRQQLQQQQRAAAASSSSSASSAPSRVSPSAARAQRQQQRQRRRAPGAGSSQFPATGSDDELTDAEDVAAEDSRTAGMSGWAAEVPMVGKVAGQVQPQRAASEVQVSEAQPLAEEGAAAKAAVPEPVSVSGGRS